MNKFIFVGFLIFSLILIGNDSSIFSLEYKYCDKFGKDSTGMSVYKLRGSKLNCAKDLKYIASEFSKNWKDIAGKIVLEAMHNPSLSVLLILTKKSDLAYLEDFNKFIAFYKLKPTVYVINGYKKDIF